MLSGTSPNDQPSVRSDQVTLRDVRSKHLLRDSFATLGTMLGILLSSGAVFSVLGSKETYRIEI